MTRDPSGDRGAADLLGAHPDLADLTDPDAVAGGPNAVGAGGFTLAAHAPVAHLTCCRASWETAVCGARPDTLAVDADELCGSCVGEADRRRPGWLEEEEGRCLLDGSPCPSEHEVDLRTMRESRC